MGKYLILKNIDGTDYFHSLIEANSTREANEQIALENDKKTELYTIVPYNNYYFDNKGAVHVPVGEKITITQTFPLNYKE